MSDEEQNSRDISMPENSETRGRDADAKRQTACLSAPQGLVSLVLNAVTGWVDAVGYLALLSSIQMFPSFMSGNLTKIVTEAVSGHGATSVKIAGAVLAFFAGGVVGRLVNTGEARRDPASLALVAGVLGASAVNLEMGGSPYLTLVALAAAMGMINHAFNGHMDFEVRTYLSGILVTLMASTQTAQFCVEAISHNDNKWFEHAIFRCISCFP
ncbi:YoaK family protein [Martelella sp. FLE1502]